MSDKHYAVLSSTATYYATYEEAEEAAKISAATPKYRRDIYDLYFTGSGHDLKQSKTNYHIVKTVAIAKEPLPNVEVVKVDS